MKNKVKITNIVQIPIAQYSTSTKGITYLFRARTHFSELARNKHSKQIIRFENNQLMNKDSQKRIIQINHAISGIYGEEIKITASKINETRKEILKKLERKKKLASIIHDELYSYLQKFPEEKSGLSQEFVKKKKAKLSQFEERYLYKTPSITHSDQSYLTRGAKQQLKGVSPFFKYHISDIQSESEEQH